jgi:regulatory protein
MADGKTKKTTALESALASLSRRPLAEAELRRKLLEKGFLEAEVNEAVIRCREYGYVNDSELVKRYAFALAREKKLGAWAVARKLETRGFSKDLVERAVTELESSQDVPSEQERAALLASKKFRGAEKRPENREKLVRFLRSKGFDWDVIRSVFNTSLD